ncbi:hypothetical protein A9Q99_23665 [Gammaproteobacteria bacterium 45_16_T64]|nr:hypothetical protein A9Q99_23665 [Gammaproteobacteria bacterium 45_16_T64]
MDYPTLIIHGFLAHKITNLPLHLGLRQQGFRTYNVPIPALNTQPIDESSQVVAERVEEVLADTGASKVNIIGVSLGGVIALHYLRCCDGGDRINKLITLGSPLRGAPASQAIRGLPFVGDVAAQLAPDSALMADMHARDINSNAQKGSTEQLISIYSEGDILVPKDRSDIEGATLLKSPYGRWPIGHYQLAADPRNIQFVIEQLKAPHPNTQLVS